MKYGFLGLLLLLPLVSSAQTTGSIQGLIIGVGNLINDVLIPFVLGIAFLIFVINVIRFFIIGGSTDEGKENAKSLALYSIGAFVLILSFWGLINIVTRGIGLANDPCIPTSDYVKNPYGVTSGTTCAPPPSDVAISPSQPVMPTPPSPSPSPLPSPTPDNPVNPSNPSPVLSTPEPEAPLSNYTPISTLADRVRSQARVYLTTTLPRNLGQNTNAVVGALFADLGTTPQTGVTDYSRMVAMVRLENAGMLTPGTALQYLTLVNTYYQTTGQTALNYAQATSDSNNSLSIPITVNNHVATTRQGIIDGLTAYNMRAPDPLTPEEQTAIIATMYNSNNSPETRFEQFTNYYINLNFDPNNTLFDQYRNDLNAEIMLRRANQNRYTLLETIPR